MEKDLLRGVVQGRILVPTPGPITGAHLKSRVQPRARGRSLREGKEECEARIAIRWKGTRDWVPTGSLPLVVALERSLSL